MRGRWRLGGGAGAVMALVAATLIVPAGAGALAARPAAAGDWIESGFDAANTRANPHETVLSTANVGQLLPSWNLAGAADGPPAVVDGHVYVESATAVNKYDERTGTLEWSFPVTTSRFFGSVAVAHGIVYAVGPLENPSTLYAINAATGKQRWRVATPGYDGRDIAVIDGLVYVEDSGGTIAAVDTTTHKIKWSFKGSDTLGRPAIAGGHAFVGGYDRKVYSLSVATGALEWSRKLDDTILVGPSVANGVVYIGSDTATMYALDATDGAVRWRFKTHSRFTTDAAIAHGSLYFGDYDTYVYSVDAATGKQRWKFKTGNTITSPPIVANGVVYVSSSDKYLYALDAATGAKLWSLYVGVSTVGNLVVSNGNLFGGFVSQHLRRFVLPD